MISVRTAALLALMALGLAACAAGSESSHLAAESGGISQIALGFWHGLIAPLTLIGEIIEAVAPNALPWSFGFYETQNTGVLYDVGFFVGLTAGPSVLWSGAGRRTRV